ncbi:MAG: PilZ domain-containing protein [Silvanigrellaceae bacterium]
MEGSSVSDQSAENAHPSDQRLDARQQVDTPLHHNVKVIMGHLEFSAECVDYSPFGMGLRFKVAADLPLFSIGDSLDLECNFVGSRFRARGSIANTRIERGQSGDFVRLGVVLSRAAEVVRPSHVKRRFSRIQMNESISPLVVVSDDLRFGDPIYGKITDVSQGGMRLIIDRHPLPILEKQRHWFDVILPVFGTCRTFCRIAYVRREDNSNRYVLGCEFIDGGGEDNLGYIEDWLYYSNYWLSLADIRASGFPLSHLHAIDEKHRILISPSMLQTETSHLETSAPDGQRVDFTVNLETEIIKLTAVFYMREKLLAIELVECKIPLFPVMVALWKAVLVFAMANQIENISIDKSQIDSPFVKVSLNAPTASEMPLSFKVRNLLLGERMHWWIWRRIYRDLKSKKEYSLPKVSSFFRKMLVI